MTSDGRRRAARARPGPSTSPSCGSSSPASPSPSPASPAAASTTSASPCPRRAPTPSRPTSRQGRTGLADRCCACGPVPGTIEVEIHDEAGGFDPDDLVPHPPVEAPERLHHERGLGRAADARARRRGRVPSTRAAARPSASLAPGAAGGGSMTRAERARRGRQARRAPGAARGQRRALRHPAPVVRRARRGRASTCGRSTRRWPSSATRR